MTLPGCLSWRKLPRTQTFDLRSEILKLLTAYPWRSTSELKACMPVKTDDGMKVADRTKATLDALVASRVVTRRIDKYKADRYAIVDVNPQL